MKTWKTTANSAREFPRTCSMFIWLYGDYLLEHPKGTMDEALRNANARAYALTHLPLHEGMCNEFWGGPAIAYTMPYAVADFDHDKSSYTDCLAAYQATTRTFRVGTNHTVPYYDGIVNKGLGDFIQRAESAFQADPTPYREAMLISLKAVSDYLRRAAAFCRSFNPECARRLEKIATDRPETFAEAIQLVMTIQDLLLVDNGAHNALGRIDQYLYPLYTADVAGRATALDALCHLMAVVGRYGQITNIAIGGVKPDGSNAENELSFLLLKAVEVVRSPSTNLSARLHDASSQAFIRACVKLISSGIGFPAVFNDHVNIAMLVSFGIPLEAARDYALVGCVETLIPGRQVPWSDGRFNLPEVFVAVVKHLETFKTYEGLWAELVKRISDGLDHYHADYCASLDAFPPKDYPMPLLSALTIDCLARGLDVNDGGAEFPRFHGIGMMGLGTLADSLSVIKKLVFEEKRLSASELIKALEADFAGYDELRQVCINHAPKYGNDDPYVDDIASEIVEMLGELTAKLHLPDGGRLQSCMASNTANVSAGAATPATPDGRRAGTPLSDAASPSCGQDREGPTAFVNSIVRPDYTMNNCTVVNMRFSPDQFKGEKGMDCMVSLLNRFIKCKGHEMQFNVTDNGVLEQAMVNPEAYGDLIVRVSGFSAFFVDLEPEVQRDILRRHVHGGDSL